MRRTSVAALALSFVLGGLVGETAARTDCTGIEYAETFEVAAKARRSVYRIGQIAVVDVFVTDSITRAPASDVHAGLLIRGRDKRSPFSAGRTDDQGHVVLRLPLRRSSVEQGWANAFAAAWESIDTPAYCTSRSGSREYPRFFRIRA